MGITFFVKTHHTLSSLFVLFQAGLIPILNMRHKKLSFNKAIKPKSSIITHLNDFIFRIFLIIEKKKNFPWNFCFQILELNQEINILS